MSHPENKDRIETIVETLDQKEFNELRQHLSVKTITIKDSTITSQQNRMWLANGLLINDKKSTLGWKKYSQTEVVWIQIILKLQKFGFSVETILSVQKQLFTPGSSAQQQLIQIEYYVIQELLGERHTILIDELGKVLIIPSDMVPILTRDSTVSFAFIPFSVVIKHITGIGNLSPVEENIFIHSQDEIDLLKFIRDNDFSKITIHLSSKKKVLVEGEEKLQLIKSIHQVLKEDKHQKIELTQSNGQVTNFKRTKKIMLNKL